MRKIFTGDNPYEAVRDAEEWLTDKGYSVSPIDKDNGARAINKGVYYMRRLSEMTLKEIEEADGFLMGHFYEGPVIIELI